MTGWIMSKNGIHSEYTKAQRHLSRRDPILKNLIRTIGPCTLRTSDDRFRLLVSSIVSQQISGKAAASISQKLHTVLLPAGITAKAIRKANDDILRSAGLSASKTRAIRDLAEKVHSGVVALDSIHEHSDEDVIAQLILVYGIGRWTAEMFLIFSLGRLDVLPAADFGLRAGIRRHYGLTELPDKEQLQELAAKWRPYCSVATWYIWRSLGGVPQSS